MFKIKKNDVVMILVGKNKGKSGIVLEIAKPDRVTVQGVNLARKHVKGNPKKGVSGGIVEKELPIHLSNVALFNKSLNKVEKTGFKFMEDGKKVRYFKSSGEIVDY